MSDTELAGNEMHILKLSNTSSPMPQYKCVPALARDGDEVPRRRAGHTACVIDNKIIMFGGFEDVAQKTPIDDNGRVWIFDPEELQWRHLDSASKEYPTRYNHAAVAYDSRLIVHGGSTSEDAAKTDTWSFDMSSRRWTELADVVSDLSSSGVRASVPPNLAILDDTVYTINGSADLNCQVHTLNLKDDAEKQWQALDFEKPGPRPRRGAGLLPVSTGMGRSYLLFMLGEKDEHIQSKDNADAETPEYWSGLWALQLPLNGYTPANVKDVARDKLGLDSGETKWAEVEIVVGEETGLMEGKSHPGPRAFFACTAVAGNKVALWGGLNPRAEAQGDGWLIDIKV